MELTFVDDSGIKSLEDYAVMLASCMLSLKTMHNLQVQAIQVGILPDDLSERCNTILWDMRRMINMHKEQLENVLELLPDDFNANKIIQNMQERELKKAKAMARKPKAKKCDT